MIYINSDVLEVFSRLEDASYLRTQDLYGKSKSAIGNSEHSWAKIDDATLLHSKEFIALEDFTVFNSRSGFICFEIALQGNYSRTIEDTQNYGEVGTVLISNSASAEYGFEQGGSTRGIVIFCNRRSFMKRFQLNIERVQERSRPIFLNDHGSLLTLRIPLFSSTMVDVDQILNCSFDEPLRSSFLSAKVTEILCTLVAQINEQGAGPRLFSPIGFKTRTLEAAAEIYRRELHNPPTIERLAERLGIDQRELTKGFQELFDKTPHRYQLQQRMEHAELLLNEGSRSISEVGRLVGYQGYRTFARAYQTYFGRPPVPVTQREADAAAACDCAASGVDI